MKRASTISSSPTPYTSYHYIIIFILRPISKTLFRSHLKSISNSIHYTNKAPANMRAAMTAGTRRETAAESGPEVSTGDPVLLAVSEGSSLSSDPDEVGTEDSEATGAVPEAAGPVELPAGYGGTTIGTTVGSGSAAGAVVSGSGSASPAALVGSGAGTVSSGEREGEGTGRMLKMGSSGAPVVKGQAPHGSVTVAVSVIVTAEPY
jgi:hypothetical protein